ncbi:MAG: T9SS type A sorting domain-containing protein [Bacteroidia bacterium]|nr:T9SS type A sorting domain-containing protein [Bacteroidia bacterium]
MFSTWLYGQKPIFNTMASFNPTFGAMQIVDTKYDNNSNSYLCGNFTGTVDVDPTSGVRNLSSTGIGSDIYILKLDKAGKLLWAHSFSNNYDNDLFGITLDQQNNIYLLGDFNGTIDLNPGAGIFNVTIPMNSENYLIKLNSDGNFQWAKKHGFGLLKSTLALNADKSGNIFTIGDYTNISYFHSDSTKPVSLGGDSFRGAFITKYDRNGEFLWVKNIRAYGNYFTSNQYGDLVLADFCIDSQSNLTVVGYFTQTVDFDPGPGVSEKNADISEDACVLKLDSNGNFIWVKTIESDVRAICTKIHSINSNSFIIAGYYAGNIDLDPTSGKQNFTANDLMDCFVIKFDGNGNKDWGKIYKTTGNDFISDICHQNSDKIYFLMGSSLKGNFTNDATLVAHPNDQILAVVKTDNQGNDLWEMQFGAIKTRGLLNGISIKSNSAEDIFLSGDYMDSIDLDPSANVALPKPNNFPNVGVYWTKWSHSNQISLVSKKLKLHIYPNPANDKIQFDFNESTSGILTVYNAAGQVVLSEVIKNQNTVSINLPIANGLYHAKFVNSNGTIHESPFIIN